MLSDAWIDIGALSEIPRQGGRVVKKRGGYVAVFRTAEEEVFALDDHFSHKGGPLSEGIVHGRGVTCPLHAQVFDLTTGAAQGADTGHVATYPARVDGGRVMLTARALAG